MSGRQREREREILKPGREVYDMKVCKKQVGFREEELEKKKLHVGS